MSFHHQPSTPWLETIRGLFKRRVKDGTLAYLGDKDGPGARTDVPGMDGYVYVRIPDGSKLSPPFTAFSAGVLYIDKPGSRVYIGYGNNGELQLIEAHFASLRQAGINTAALNPLNPQSRWVYPWQITTGLALAVATSTTASTRVMVKEFYHLVGNVLQKFNTPLQADKPNLAAHIPTVNEHCYAALWIDTYTNSAVVTTSVAQSIEDKLDATDLQELVVRVASSRPADGVPLKAFYLANDQSTIVQNRLDVDLRPFLDMPVPWGFPTTLTTLERVRPGYTLVTGPYTASGVGALTIESGGRVIIVHKLNVTSTAPTVNDDSGDGYSVGSLWLDTSTDTLYVAKGVTIGAAVWSNVSGASGITQLTGDIAAGPGSGSQTATIAPLAVTTGKLGALAVTDGKVNDVAIGKLTGLTTKGDIIARNTTGPVRQAVGATDGHALIVDSSASTGLSYGIPYIDLTVTWGESSMTVRSSVARRASDGKWYKASSDPTASPLRMGEQRAIVSDAGTGAANTTGKVRVWGPLPGFSSLTPNACVRVDTTNGTLTQTAASMTTLIEADLGYAMDASTVFVQCHPPRPVTYRTRTIVTSGAVTTLTHHPNLDLTRDCKAYAIHYSDAIQASYAETNRDTDVSLLGAAGGTTVIDNAGAGTTFIGSDGANTRRVSQSLTVTAATRLITFILRFAASIGAPIGPINWRLETNDVVNDKPSGGLYATGASGSFTPTPSSDNQLTITGFPAIPANTKLWIVLESATTQASGVRWQITINTAGAYSGGSFKNDTAPFTGAWAGGGGTNDMRSSFVTSTALGLAQSYTSTSLERLTRVRLWMKRTGNPNYDLRLRIYSNSGGVPGSILGTASTLVATSSLGTAYGWAEWEFYLDNLVFQAIGTVYQIAVEPSGGSPDALNYVEWGADSSSPTATGSMSVEVTLAGWQNITPATDACFEIYSRVDDFIESIQPGSFTRGTGDFAYQYGDASDGNNADTVTRFKNTDTKPQEAIYETTFQ